MVLSLLTITVLSKIIPIFNYFQRSLISWFGKIKNIKFSLYWVKKAIKQGLLLGVED